MPKEVIHFTTRALSAFGISSSSWRKTACGCTVDKVWTNAWPPGHPQEVTCGRCKRTYAYRKSLERRRRSARAARIDE